MLLFAAVLYTFSFSSAVRADEEEYPESPAESDSWENWPRGPEIQGQTGCLMEMETGAVLYAKGGQDAMYPASITKVMTALIVLENCDLSSVVTMTETGLAYSQPESSGISAQAGEQFTVDQCLQMLMVRSANDVASQLAEFTAGSADAFVERMNSRAAELGCVNTHFTNATGSEDPGQYTCAYDMTLILRDALRYDRFREIIAANQITIPPTEYSDTRVYDNHVFLRQDGEYYYDGCLGGKTGYSESSGSTLVCAAERNGRVLVGAVLGAPDTASNAVDMRALFDYGFSEFNHVDLTRGYEMFVGVTPTAAPPKITDMPVSVTPEVTPALTTAAPTAEPAAVSSAGPADTSSEEVQTVSEVTAVPTPEVTQPVKITTSDADLNTDRSAERTDTTKKKLAVIAVIVLASAVAILLLLQRRARMIRERNRAEYRKRRNGGGEQ